VTSSWSLFIQQFSVVFDCLFSVLRTHSDRLAPIGSCSTGYGAIPQGWGSSGEAYQPPTNPHLEPRLNMSGALLSLSTRRACCWKTFAVQCVICQDSERPRLIGLRSLTHFIQDQLMFVWKHGAVTALVQGCGTATCSLNFFFDIQRTVHYDIFL